MSEQQETVHIVMRRGNGWLEDQKPVKAFDDRADARAYARRYNQTSRRYKYSVVSVKKG